MARGTAVRQTKFQRMHRDRASLPVGRDFLAILPAARVALEEALAAAKPKGRPPKGAKVEVEE